MSSRRQEFQTSNINKKLESIRYVVKKRNTSPQEKNKNKIPRILLKLSDKKDDVVNYSSFTKNECLNPMNLDILVDMSKVDKSVNTSVSTLSRSMEVTTKRTKQGAKTRSCI